jgi:hypothetical protein
MTSWLPPLRGIWGLKRNTVPGRGVSGVQSDNQHTCSDWCFPRHFTECKSPASPSRRSVVAKTCIGHPLGVSHTHISGSSGPWTAMGMCWSRFNSDNGLHMLQVDGAGPSIRVSPSLQRYFSICLRFRFYLDPRWDIPLKIYPNNTLPGRKNRG